MGLIKTSQPALHGDQHLCDGSDPIPGICGLLPSGGGWPDYQTGVLAISGLRGYWRLGEGAFDYADTSDYNPGDPGDLALVTVPGRVAMTQNFTPGALSVDDDGAVRFNYDGDATMVGPVGEFMQTAIATDLGRYNPDPLTVACWIRPLASAHTYQGTILGTLSFHASADKGWRFQIEQPSRVVGFAVSPNLTTAPYPKVETPAGLAADTWHHIAATYDGTSLKLYVAGTLVDELAYSSGLGSPATSSATVFIGEGPHKQADYGQFFYGAVDEVAVWAGAATATEIADLYAAGAGTGSVPAGQVPTSDGEGGVSYAYPTVKVDGTRYDEILAGTGLSSTDNTDGTVTLASTGAPTGGTSPTDTAGWMPLTTVVGGVPDLVWDSTDSLIPTYGPF